MNALTKLKHDRDTCYFLACAAYGQEWVNEQLWEGDTPNERDTRIIQEARQVLQPIPKGVPNVESTITDGFWDEPEGVYYDSEGAIRTS